MRTRFWKLTALFLALMIALSGCSLITVDQEMEMAETVAVVGDTKITKGEVIDLYKYQLDYTAYIYQYYYGMEGLTGDEVEAVKDTVLDAYIRRELTHQKLAELALTDFSEESYAEADAEAEAYYEESLASHAEHVDTEGMTEEEARDALVAHLEAEGTTLESIKQNYRDSHDQELLYNYVVENITISDEEVQAAYESKVTEDEATYGSSSYLFELYNTYGYTIAWQPEGYRTVKQILFMADDETTAEMEEISTRLSEIDTELTDLAIDDAAKQLEADWAAQEAAEEGESAEETTEETTEETAEETTEEIDLNATLTALHNEKTELEERLATLKADLLATFQEKTDDVYARLEAGESFEDLMAELSEDPGMQEEPNKTTGYFVCETSSTWDVTFRDASMALEKVGDVSEPVVSNYGVHIIYYNSDVTAGPVDIETIREALTEEVLTAKQEEAYNAQYEQWLKDANVKKYPKVLG